MSLVGSLMVFLAACQPAAPLNAPPTPVPFPTVTPGRMIHGLLPITVGLPLNGLANPATAVALANRPTPAPDYSLCPPAAQPSLPPLPTQGREITAAITAFLSSGGSAAALADSLRANWNILGDTGAIRGDIDFTGEGTPDILLTYAAPDDGGTLLILTCANGLYTPLYQAITGGNAPQVISLGDLNADNRPDILSSSYSCSPDNPDDCSYRTQLMTWKSDEGRFASLLNGAINSTSAPSINDVDSDRVLEIVVRLDDAGNSATGPLRTGVNIYDWNGSVYTLSIVQLDPPRFQIQVIQEADRAFARLETDQAIPLYELAYNDKTLHFWFNDDPTILKSYLYYRMMLAYAYTDSDKLLPTYQAAQTDFPDPTTGPVYVSMVNALWNGWQVTHNLHSACVDVQAIITARPEAVSLLNRYGSRSPTYAAQDLCPF
jgi:hypothetical protein